MTKCSKNCYHYEVCSGRFDCEDYGCECLDFKDKSLIVEMPCKVGQTVYQITRNFISEFRVRFIEVSRCDCIFIHTDIMDGIIFTGEVFSEDEISKTVFLTREEAERALEEREKNETD